MNETFTWTLPNDLAAGDVTVEATVYYSRLVSSVGEFLEVPEEEWEPIRVGSHSTRMTVLP
jgi:hypothetical protein